MCRCSSVGEILFEGPESRLCLIARVCQNVSAARSWGRLCRYDFPDGGIMTRDPINILLVDDHPAKLLTYEAILQNLGENLIKDGTARHAPEHLLKEDIAIAL